MLRISRHASEGVCVPEVVEAMGRTGRSGHVVVLAPSRAHVVCLQRFLAAQGMGLGITVETPSGWVEERWALLGDGRQPVGDIERLLMVSRLVRQQARSEEDTGLGTVKTLCSLIKQALPWLPEHAKACATLTTREYDVIALAEEYEAEATKAGLIEQSRMLQMLPGKLVEAGIEPTIVFVGFSSLPYGPRWVAVQLARTFDVEVMVPAGEGAGFRQPNALAAQLQALAGDVGVACAYDEAPAAAANPERAEELQQMLERLFAEHEIEPIERASAADGAVELLMPAGPLAQARAVADKVAQLIVGGARDVVVAASDAKAAWRSLAPRLSASGVQVNTTYRVRPVDAEAGKAFVGLAESVVELSEAQEAIDACDAEVSVDPRNIALSSTQLREGSIGDMAWWPPSKVVDFLLSDIAQVDRSAAWALDRRWRGTRALAPAKVLDTLSCADATSKTCAIATSLMRKGDFTGAAAALKAPVERALSAAFESQAGVDGDKPAAASHDIVVLREHLSVLEAFEEAARQVARMAGVDAGDGWSASELRAQVEEIVLAASATSVAVRPIAYARGAEMKDAPSACVRVVSPYEAARLQPCSCDALVYLDLDTIHAPAGMRSSAAALLLDKLGLEPKVPPIDATRWAFLSCMRVPRTHLVLERCAHGASASESYQAAMLAELLACYPEALDENGKSRGSVLQPASNMPETAVMANVLPHEQVLSARKDEARSGAPLDELLLLPSKSQADYGDEDEQAAASAASDETPAQMAGPAARALLSPTQIETYLHCPQKWLAEKRLGLSGIDAGCDALEEGSFAHEVLEGVYRHCKEHDEADPLEVFDDIFASALVEQFGLGEAGEPASVLVPHCKKEDFGVARLYANLRDTVAFSKDIFDGFKPAYFELGFGRKHLKGHEGEPDVPFGTICLCGSIDRVDIYRDEDGQQYALVVDYKRAKHLDKYALSFIEEPAEGDPAGDEDSDPATPSPEGLSLPYHVQGLVYAWVLRYLARDPEAGPALGLDPDLKVIGAVYLGTGDTRSIFGAVDEAYADAVFGNFAFSDAPKREQVVMQQQPCTEGIETFDAYLDVFKEALLQKLAGLLEGRDVAPRPWGEEKSTSLCAYCSVSNCPERRK